MKDDLHIHPRTFITFEVVSLGVSPSRQRLEGDDYYDDEATCGCLPSHQRSRD